jgi:hypothetical protein
MPRGGDDVAEEEARGLIASVRAFAQVTDERNQEEQEGPPLSVTVEHSKQGQEEISTLTQPWATESKELRLSDSCRCQLSVIEGRGGSSRKCGTGTLDRATIAPEIERSRRFLACW